MVFVPVKGNCNTPAFYTIVHFQVCVNSFEEEPHMRVMVECPHTFGRMVYRMDM